jgi:hypothetical protein
VPGWPASRMPSRSGCARVAIAQLT